LTSRPGTTTTLFTGARRHASRLRAAGGSGFDRCAVGGGRHRELPQLAIDLQHELDFILRERIGSTSGHLASSSGRAARNPDVLSTQPRCGTTG
jgi:hypothetical protein